MTDIGQRGQALSEEIRAEASKLIGFSGPTYQVLTRWADSVEALCRAIEQHEAFRREVSEAVVFALKVYGGHRTALDPLRRFIIPQPDPLVEALSDIGTIDPYGAAKDLRAALAARSLEIAKKEPSQ